MVGKWIGKAMKISDDIAGHHVGAYAAQAAYFFMLSLIPIILLLLTMVQYTPVTKADVMTAVVQVFPSTVDSLITSIVNQVYNQSSTVMVSRKGCSFDYDRAEYDSGMSGDA